MFERLRLSSVVFLQDCDKGQQSPSLHFHKLIEIIDHLWSLSTTMKNRKYKRKRQKHLPQIDREHSSALICFTFIGFPNFLQWKIELKKLSKFQKLKEFLLSQGKKRSASFLPTKAQGLLEFRQMGRKKMRDEFEKMKNTSDKEWEMHVTKKTNHLFCSSKSSLVLHAI